MNDVVLTSFATAAFTVTCTYGFDRYKNFKNTNLKRLSILNALSAALSTLKALIEDRKKGFEMTKVSFPSSTLAYIPISFNYFSVQNSTFSPARIILVVLTAHIFPHMEQVWRSAGGVLSKYSLAFSPSTAILNISSQSTA